MASPAGLALRATATDAAPRIVFAICVFAVAARLILINQPYVDHWSWRQSDVAAIARNFLQNGFRFGYPQIDWAGNAAGYVGTEFPILPFIAALCYKFAGIHEWVGRIQAVILFAVSLPCFFLLVREIFGSTAAVWATFFYSFAPVNIFAGRSFMPDVPSLSFAIVGLYLLLRYVDHNESSSFFVAAIALSLSFLIKITSIVIVAPLVYLAVAEGADLGCVKGPGRAAAAFNARGYSSRFSPSSPWCRPSSGTGTRIKLQRNFIPTTSSAPAGFEPNLFRGTRTSQNRLWYPVSRQPSQRWRSSVCLPRARSRYSRLFHWWLAAMIVFIIIVGYGNRHRWYQLPLVPIAAAFAGAGCAFVGSKISSRVAAITSSILLAITFLILAFLCVRPFYESSAAQLRDAGLELKKVTPPDALIVAADMGDPTIFYYGERKGWHFLEQNAIYNGNPDDGEQAIENLERLRHRGATHFVFTRNTFWWLQSYPEFVGHLSKHAMVIEATPEFRIYELITSSSVKAVAVL